MAGGGGKRLISEVEAGFIANVGTTISNNRSILFDCRVRLPSGSISVSRATERATDRPLSTYILSYILQVFCMLSTG